jgi:hypothetical protein
LYSEVSLQHFDGAGLSLFPASGVSVSTLAAQQRFHPWLDFDPVTGETLVAWSECNGNQTSCGVYAQKLSTSGERLWGDTGKALQPIEPDRQVYEVAGLDLGDEAVIAWVDTGTDRTSRVRAARIDAEGRPVWSQAIVEVSTVASAKDGLWIAPDPTDALVLAWSDARDDAPGVYGQSLRLDGTLGGASRSVRRHLQRTGTTSRAIDEVDQGP